MFKFVFKFFRRFRKKGPHEATEAKLVELRDTDLRNAAEHAYVLAVLFQRDGNLVKAKAYGKEAIQLLDRSKLRTEWDAQPRNVAIEGVTLPNPIHQRIVRETLNALQL